MKDILSYKQLYNELENLNTSAYDALLNEDFESFCSSIDNFFDSGITKQERFADARKAWRFSTMPFTLNSMWVSVDSRNVMTDHIAAISGWYINDLKQRDVYPLYACLTQQEKVERAENKLIAKRMDALKEYKKLYGRLYEVPRRTTIFGETAFVDDEKKHKMIYIDRIAALAATRSRFHLTFDFSCSRIDNEALASKSIPEKMQYLSKNFPSIFQKKAGEQTEKVEDYFTFNSYDEKILASNYIQGKNIDRKNWKNYVKGTMPSIPLFYLELAFYLSIPSSDEIERFMNLHGYSIKSPMTHFCDILCGKRTYHILHSDLCRWIDAGIDYNLINEMCGYQLQRKEIRKSKTN